MKKKIASLASLVMAVFLFAFIVGGWSLLLADEGGSGDKAFSPEGFIRLHIVANSDSAVDQETKHKVREAVTAYLAPYLADAGTVEEAREKIAARRQEIAGVARRAVAESGADYTVRLETGWHEYPLRSYGTLVLPPGRYESVRILLGAAQGQNWWCVLFPPLCFIDIATAPAPAVAGSDAAKPTDGERRVEVRWKILELLDERR